MTAHLVFQMKNYQLSVCKLVWAIGSLMAEHKASNSLVFNDIKYRQNIAGHNHPIVFKVLPKVILVLCRVAWANPWVITVQESAHATLPSATTTLALAIQFENVRNQAILTICHSAISQPNCAFIVMKYKQQWSTESRNIWPKQNIFIIRLSASAAEILF